MFDVNKIRIKIKKKKKTEMTLIISKRPSALRPPTLIQTKARPLSITIENR